MKKMLFTLVSMLTIAVSANAMSYEQARREALFLTDKMAYELNLNDAQYEAAYEINLDYLMGVTSYDNVFGPYWERRNLDLSYILYSWQWDLFRAASYFYRPLYWEAGHWHFGIYLHYPHRDYFYFGRPHFYTTYRGGHSWRHNGGRSWYEGRHSNFRPVEHRDNHVGMRNSWDRGDYRNNSGRSSTRITERSNHNMDGSHKIDGNRSTNENRNLDNNRRMNDNRSLGGHRGATGNNRELSTPRSTNSSREMNSNRSTSIERSVGAERSTSIGRSTNSGRSAGSGSFSRGSSSSHSSRSSVSSGSRSNSNSGGSRSGRR